MSSTSRNYNNNYSFKSANSFLSPFQPNKSSFNLMNIRKKETKNLSPINIIINDLNYIRSKKNIGIINHKFLDSSKINISNNISNKNSFKFNNSQNLKFMNLSNNNIKNINLNNKNKENNYILNKNRAKSKSNLGKKILSYDYLNTEIPSVNIFQKAQKIKNITNLKILYHPKNNFQKNSSSYYDDLFSFPNKININMDNNKKGINEVSKGPEEMHWYFVKCIQDGKKVITKFDDL